MKRDENQSIWLPLVLSGNICCSDLPEMISIIQLDHVFPCFLLQLASKIQVVHLPSSVLPSNPKKFTGLADASADDIAAWELQGLKAIGWDHSKTWHHCPARIHRISSRIPNALSMLWPFEVVVRQGGINHRDM